MCGIAGVMHTSGRPADEKTVRAMADTLVHRGPDDSGIYVSGSVGLGHRRLSIIDLSDAGRQPMCNEDGTVWITYNGEIYNFADIRRDLEARGHRFKSNTDTEVVVHAYEEWGPACLRLFNGMFAFGLWDARSRRLWLVRDRIGIKPLFYSVLPDRVLFGSEIKAVLADPAVPREMDFEALSYFMALNWMPAPWTLFSKVRQVEPGHYLMIEAGGTARDVEYWDLAYEEETRTGEREAMEELGRRVEEAVRLRLVSDVPFGAFLSGGVDSSTVSYFMAKNLPEPLKTFSIHFGEPTYDEDKYACAVAESIGSEHNQQKVTAELATVLPRLVWHSEEPTADASMVAVYYLARETRRHVTMVQSGDGADELLAGYETYQAHYAHRLFRMVPRFIRKNIIEKMVGLIPPSDAKVSLDFKIRQFVAGADFSPEDAHACWRMVFDADWTARLLAPLAGREGAGASVFDLYRSTFSKTGAAHPLNRLLYLDTRLYLPADMLVKVDRMTMAHSLEARVPFLDHTLAEYIASLPPALKLKGLRHKKYILKKMMSDKLPGWVLWRKKQGFNVPKASWIKNELKDFVTDHLSPSMVSRMGFLEPREVDRLLEDHFRGKQENSYRIWCLLTLSLWWQQFIQGNRN